MPHTLPPRKLTIGILTHDDYSGLYFSIQAIRMYHPEVLDEIEFLIIDNNPDGLHGQAVERLTKWIKEPVGYLAIRNRKGTALRHHIFTKARTPYVMSIDSHVLIAPGALRKLIDFFDSKADGGNLLQGPLVYDDEQNIATHFNLIWQMQMWGVWATDERGKNPEADPFEIPAQGLGLFACRKNSWLGFNPKFRGFGGEEGYIHEKYRQAGRKTLCLPFLRWLHRFDRPAGVPYPVNIEDRVRNYLIGHAELGLDTAPIVEHFAALLPRDRITAIYSEAIGQEPKLPPKIIETDNTLTTIPFWIMQNAHDNAH